MPEDQTTTIDDATGMHLAPDSLAQASGRRSGDDRRQHHWKAFFYSFFKDRRQGPRRQTDKQHDYYVDIHEPRYLYVILLTLALCVVDVYFTLTIIDAGGEELNPFMRYLIELDTQIFIAVKFFITAMALIFLLAHKHFRLIAFKSGALLYMALAAYSLLVAYEIFLLSQIELEWLSFGRADHFFGK